MAGRRGAAGRPVRTMPPPADAETRRRRPETAQSRDSWDLDSLTSASLSEAAEARRRSERLRGKDADEIRHSALEDPDADERQRVDNDHREKVRRQPSRKRKKNATAELTEQLLPADSSVSVPAKRTDDALLTEGNLGQAEHHQVEVPPQRKRRASGAPPSLQQQEDEQQQQQVESAAAAASSQRPAWLNDLLGVHRLAHESLPEVGDGVVFSMRRREQRARPDPSYLQRQRHMTAQMRATLFDWMFEVGQEFVLTRDTLHTALALVDRFLSRRSDVPKRQLQLVGVTALWVAAKNKEVYAPKAKEFAFSTDSAYAAQDLVLMEREMLAELDWQVDPVTPFAWVDWFLHRLYPSATTTVSHRGSSSSSSNSSHGGGPHVWMAPPRASLQLFNRVMEVLDAALLDMNALHFLPSALAATALLLVLREQREGTAASVERVTRYAESELLPCARWMEVAQNVPQNRQLLHPKIRHISLFFAERDWHCIQRHNKQALPVLDAAGYVDIAPPAPAATAGSAAAGGAFGYALDDSQLLPSGLDEAVADPPHAFRARSVSSTSSMGSPDMTSAALSAAAPPTAPSVSSSPDVTSARAGMAAVSLHRVPEHQQPPNVLPPRPPQLSRSSSLVDLQSNETL